MVAGTAAPLFATSVEEPFTYSSDIVWVVSLATIGGGLLVAAVFLVAYIASPLPVSRTDPFGIRTNKLSRHAGRAAVTALMVAVIALMVAAVTQDLTDRARFVAYAAAAGYILSDTQIDQLLDEGRAYTVLADGTVLDAAHAIDGIHLVPRTSGVIDTGVLAPLTD